MDNKAQARSYDGSRVVFYDFRMVTWECVTRTSGAVANQDSQRLLLVASNGGCLESMQISIGVGAMRDEVPQRTVNCNYMVAC